MFGKTRNTLPSQEKPAILQGTHLLLDGTRYMSASGSAMDFVMIGKAPKRCVDISRACRAELAATGAADAASPSRAKRSRSCGSGKSGAAGCRLADCAEDALTDNLRSQKRYLSEVRRLCGHTDHPERPGSRIVFTDLDISNLDFKMAWCGRR